MELWEAGQPEPKRRPGVHKRCEAPNTPDDRPEAGRNSDAQTIALAPEDGVY
jgi:hypothetical protein